MMRKATPITISMTAASLLLLACGGGDSDALRGRGNPAPAAEPQAAPGEQPAADDPALCTGREYVGYGATKLAERRAVAKLGANRGRVKPFGALNTEFERVLGNKPASLATAYDIAFDGCLTYVATEPKLAQAPTAASAQDACATTARRFWSKA